MARQRAPFLTDVDEDLRHLSVDALFLLKNAPLAAVERPFKNNALNEYFYKRRRTDVDPAEQAAAEKRMNSVDQANVAAVAREWERRKAAPSTGK